jgi:acyl phosphate:glycerol-3-phosphate acyltransferase
VLAFTWRDALVLLAAYLLGSIPFSYLVARQRGVDVRTVGSGNVGATNVMRSVGRGAGLVAFVLDFLKGSAATALAVKVSGGSEIPSLAAVVAVLGHMFPIWLRGRGGKGVAPGAGAFLPIAPLPTLVSLLTFGLTLALSRYVSVSSIAGTLALAAATRLTGLPLPVTIAAVVSAALVIWKHRGNLQRIANGTENRIGTPRPAGPA